MKILVTGATGFIGKRVVEKLCSKADSIYILTREQSFEKAQSLFNNYPNVSIIPGDVSKSSVIINESDRNTVTKEITQLLNIAAHYDLEMSEQVGIKHNICGQENVIKLAKECQNLTEFHHISTYAVCGQLSGTITEDTMDDKKRIRNPYSKTKMLAEKMLRESELEGVKIRIYRPGIVIGETESGAIEKIDGPYYLMRFLKEHSTLLKITNLLGLFPFPYDKDAPLPLISVDTIATWLVEMITNTTDHQLRSYHLLPEPPTRLYEFVQKILPSYGIKAKIMRLPKSKVYKYIIPYLGLPSELFNYMYCKANYSVENRKKDFPNLVEFDLELAIPNMSKGLENYLDSRRHL